MSRLTPVRVGDVIKVIEEDYIFGTGSLTLRITQVHGLLFKDDGPWVVVDGIPLWFGGKEGEERYVAIRLAAIGRLRRRRQPESSES